MWPAASSASARARRRCPRRCRKCTKQRRRCDLRERDIARILGGGRWSNERRSVPSWVLILMGSDSDMPVMSEAATALDDVGVPYTITVASAHRTPERTKQIVNDAENDGCVVFIAGAGM